MLYKDADMLVPAEISTFHASELASFAQSGTWLTGEERSAVVNLVRQLRVSAGSAIDSGVPVQPAPASVLPEAVLALVERLAMAPQKMTHEVYLQAVADGISEPEYVEIVGVVARSMNVDMFSHGLGLAPRQLGTPSSVEPDCERPAGVVNEGAWVATLPGGQVDNAVEAQLYRGNMQPFIYRALSLVPDEAARVIAGGNTQYLSLEHFFDYEYSKYPALTRAEVELVAGQVSAFNDCFY